MKHFVIRKTTSISTDIHWRNPVIRFHTPELFGEEQHLRLEFETLGVLIAFTKELWQKVWQEVNTLNERKQKRRQRQ